MKNSSLVKKKIELFYNDVNKKKKLKWKNENTNRSRISTKWNKKSKFEMQCGNVYFKSLWWKNLFSKKTKQSITKQQQKKQQQKKNRHFKNFLYKNKNSEKRKGKKKTYNELIRKATNYLNKTKSVKYGFL